MNHVHSIQSYVYNNETLILVSGNGDKLDVFNFKDFKKGEITGDFGDFDSNFFCLKDFIAKLFVGFV